MKYEICIRFQKNCKRRPAGQMGIAVIAGLIAALLGAVSSSGPEVNLNFSDNGASFDFSFANQQIYSSSNGWMSELNGILVGGALYIILAGIILAAVFFVLGSIIEVGYARFNLDLVDRQEKADLGTLFHYFSHWNNAALTRLLKSVYIVLWTLLFIIPGIIASYSYAMTGYILAENPDLEPDQAIALSKQMMSGNRWRLFCLHFSFIGWGILAALTLGIGNLWLTPYVQASTAAFYREISGTERLESGYVPVELN